MIGKNRSRLVLVIWRMAMRSNNVNEYTIWLQNWAKMTFILSRTLSIKRKDFGLKSEKKLFSIPTVENVETRISDDDIEQPETI
jgi:hypothetical protein